MTLSMPHFINNLVTAICQPSTKIDSDPRSRNLIFSQNKLTLNVLIVTFIFRTAMMLFSNFSPSFDLIQFCMIATFLALFLLLCRSFQMILHISITISGFLWCYYGLVTYPDLVPYYHNLALVTPPFIYFVSRSVPIMASSAILQAFVLHGIYRRKLMTFLLTTDPEEFVHQFTDYGIAVLLFITAGYGYLIKNLDQKTSEISQAVKLAEDALEQQRTFIYSFSHELRNPINSLLGNLQLVLMNNINLEVREMVNTARICGELLLNLINTMLDAGKLDLGKLEVNPAPIRIHDLLQRIWVISNDILSKKDITSHLKVEKRVPPVLLLDGHRIHQILMNLIGNAIKFTQKGSITITIQWLESTQVTNKSFEPIPYDDVDEGVFEKEENMHFVKMKNQGKESRDYFFLSGSNKEFNLDDVVKLEQETQGVLKIIVKDTGCGMTKEEVVKLFQKFSQVGQDSLKKQLGSGLGLFISKELCQSMNGDIRVYSRAKVGATFVFCIPTSAIKSADILGIEKEDETIQNQLISRKLKTIVADDSIFNVNLVTNFFAKIDAQVIGTANNGKSAFEKYVEARESGQEVDVVTLDIDMPVMNGKVACEKIRGYERQNNLNPTVIILISGNYEQQQLNTYLDRDLDKKADCFLRKPLLFEEFRWSVYKHVFKCT